MYRHLVCANDFYVESLEGMNDALLDNLVDELNVQMEKVKLCIEERAKRGLFAASSVPISMTGPNPKRKDPTARFAKVPDKSSDNSPFIKLPQPEYTMLPNCEVDTVCIPDLYDEESIFFLTAYQLCICKWGGGTSISSFFCWPAVFPT